MSYDRIASCYSRSPAWLLVLQGAAAGLAELRAGGVVSGLLGRPGSPMRRWMSSHRSRTFQQLGGVPRD